MTAPGTLQPTPASYPEGFAGPRLALEAAGEFDPSEVLLGGSLVPPRQGGREAGTPPLVVLQGGEEGQEKAERQPTRMAAYETEIEHGLSGGYRAPCEPLSMPQSRPPRKRALAP